MAIDPSSSRVDFYELNLLREPLGSIDFGKPDQHIDVSIDARMLGPAISQAHKAID